MGENDLGIDGIYVIDLPRDSYYGCKLARFDIDVDDSLVEGRFRELVEKVSWQELDGRPIEDGDMVVLSYCGEVASERIEPVEVQMRVGSGELIASVEEKLLGCHSGDKLSFDVSLPDICLVEEWEEKTAHVGIEIRSALRLNDDEITDEYVASISDFGSVDELKAAIREQFQEESVQEAHRLTVLRLVEMISKEIKAHLDDDALLKYALSISEHSSLDSDALGFEERQGLIDEAAFEVAWRNIARIEGMDGHIEAEQALNTLENVENIDPKRHDEILSRMQDGIVCDKVMEFVFNNAQFGAEGQEVCCEHDA